MSAAIDWQQTAAWYDENAALYAQSAGALPISPLVKRFAAALPKAARVLDAGCGAGRDAAWLSQQGFAVSGFDASRELASHARIALLGRGTVRQMRFCDYDDPAASWDGILSMASLLHMPKAEITDALTRLLKSLKAGGILAISLKEGEGEAQDRHGRSFSYYQEAELADLLHEATDTESRLEIWSSLSLQPSSDQTPTRWIDMIARKHPKE